MRFFSKLVLICNVCFIISVIMRYMELSNRAKGNTESIIKLQPLENTLVILGYGAIFLNVIFVFIALYLLLRKRLSQLPRWITVFNVLLFIWQLYYFKLLF